MFENNRNLKIKILNLQALRERIKIFGSAPDHQGQLL